MKKIVFFLLGVSLLIGAYFVFFRQTAKNVEVEKIDPNIQKMMTTNESEFLVKSNFSTEEIIERRKILKIFIEKNLLSGEGILTNYLANAKDTEVATGHELLSESSGIYLRNLVLTDTKEQYDTFYDQTKALFYDKVQFSYRVNEDNKKFPVNAAVDDLRIMRSLVEASAQFGEGDYKKELDAITKNFMDTSMDKNILIDFYDVQTKERSSETSLFYINLKMLGYLYSKYDVPVDYLQYHYELIQNGYLSDDFPLYQTKYNQKKKVYENNGTINIIESLLTILYLSECQLQKKESIDFIKQQVAKGTLFNSYDLNGNPVDKNQSAASYAIAAIIGSILDDEELYNSAIQILNNFQITDKNSSLYGGFGDTRTEEVFSFNNLMALLAYEY